MTPYSRKLLAWKLGKRRDMGRCCLARCGLGCKAGYVQAVGRPVPLYKQHRLHSTLLMCRRRCSKRKRLDRMRLLKQCK